MTNFFTKIKTNFDIYYILHITKCLKNKLKIPENAFVCENSKHV